MTIEALVAQIYLRIFNSLGTKCRQSSKLTSNVLVLAKE